MKLLIIQPWFCAIGHPAQSLINTASAIGKDERVEYLVSRNSESDLYINSFDRLSEWGKVKSYEVKTPTGDSNTTGALWALLRMLLTGHKYQRIFFFDESFISLASYWPRFSLLYPVERLGVLLLNGPEVFKGSAWPLVERFLLRPEVRLYLRTEELKQAWSVACKEISGRIRISTLPSLEIPDDHLQQRSMLPVEQVKFGVIGQIRPGKGLDWLVPTFQKYPDIGKLTVAGEYFNQKIHGLLSFLDEFEGFVNCYMTEEEMLDRASMQDYLLMLYDGAWDKRMESAVLYLAARVNRPVITYGDCWCGRMVREFGCGVLAPNDRDGALDLLRRAPNPGSAEYAKLLEGVNAFRQAHSVKSLRGKVIQEMLG